MLLGKKVLGGIVNLVLAGILTGCATPKCPTLPPLSQSPPSMASSRTIDSLVTAPPNQSKYDDGKHIENGRLKEGNVLLITANMHNLSNPDGKDNAYYEREICGSEKRNTWETVLKVYDFILASHIYQDGMGNSTLPQLLDLFDYIPQGNILLPRDVKDRKKIKNIAEFFRNENLTQIRLKNGELIDDYTKRLISNSTYFTWLQKQYESSKKFSGELVFREVRAIAKSGLNGSEKVTDEDFLSGWYNQTIEVIGAKIIPNFVVDTPVSQDMSGGYVRFQSDLYIDSQYLVSRHRIANGKKPSPIWRSDFRVPSSVFSEIIKRTKYYFGDLSETTRQLEENFNSDRIDADHVRIMDGIWVYLTLTSPQYTGPRYGATGAMLENRIFSASTNGAGKPVLGTVRINHYNK